MRGNSRTVVEFTVAPNSDEVDSTVGASVLTSTVWFIWPTRIVKSRSCWAPTVSVTPFCTAVLNPVAETRIS